MFLKFNFNYKGINKNYHVEPFEISKSYIYKSWTSVITKSKAWWWSMWPKHVAWYSYQTNKGMLTKSFVYIRKHLLLTLQLQTRRIRNSVIAGRAVKSYGLLLTVLSNLFLHYSSQHRRCLIYDTLSHYVALFTQRGGDVMSHTYSFLHGREHVSSRSD